MSAEELLLSQSDVQGALGATVTIDRVEAPGAPPASGNVLRAAAQDSAFRRYAGHLVLEGEARPVTVSMLALVFDSSAQARHTFDQVAGAAHLATAVGPCLVAVETVTAPSELVSYWGFIYFESAIVVLTLDTLDPTLVSVSDLRSLVSAAARRLSAS